MLTGQFNELRDSIGSGVPIRIHKLDNNGTVVDIKVECFTKAEEIPYPWNDHPWSDYFVGYSVSRNTLQHAGTITSPVELYCFYDAEVTLTYKLPIPGGKTVSVQYGVGQYPQLHDINGNDVLLTDFDSRLSFCLPDGSSIDGMPKPLENTEVNVLICNHPETFHTDTFLFSNYVSGYGLKSDGKIMTFTMKATMPKVAITPVTIEIPQGTTVTVTGTMTSFGHEGVPTNIDIFDKPYTIQPQSSEVVGNGYLQGTQMGTTGTTKLISQLSGVPAMGFIFGSATTSVPTSFPTGTPSLVDKTSIKLGSSTYSGYPISDMTINYGRYIPFRARAKLADFASHLTVSLSVDQIRMNGLPQGVTGWYTNPRLRDWLEQGNDASVADWWRSNYSSIFYTA